MNHSTKLNSCLPFISKKSIPFIRPSRRGFSEKKIESTQIPTPVDEKPKFVTKHKYESGIQQARIKQNVDAETGTQPTYMQKWFLVITRIFPNRQVIPKYILRATMSKMYGRLSIIVISSAIAIFFVCFFLPEHRLNQKIERDRASGKVVTRMA